MVKPTIWHYVNYIPRKILVRAPEKWTEEQNMKFVELVNIKTETGWMVTLVIKNGDIIITDPDIEKRTIKEFIPLLLNSANMDDVAIINEFFSDNPL